MFNFQASVPAPTYPTGASRQVIFKLSREYDALVRAEFFDYLAKELGIEDNPKKGIFLEKMYNEYHHDGYQLIYNMAQDWVDLIL